MAREYVVINDGNVLGTGVFTLDDVKRCEAEGFRLLTPEQYATLRHAA